MRHSVKFRQQFDAVFPSDQNALQRLAVLLHLKKVTWSISHQQHVPQRDSMTLWTQWYLHLIFSKDTIQDEVSPEHGPLTFDILKQLELCRIVVQPRWVLMRQQAQNYTQLSHNNNSTEIQTTTCRISHLFGAAISIPEEAAAAITTLKWHQREDILPCWLRECTWVSVVVVKLSLYLQFAYDFWFSDSHQVSILNGKRREGNDTQKAGVYLLWSGSSWQHGAQDGLGGGTYRRAEGRKDEQRRCGWRRSQQYLTMFYFIRQNVDDWLRPSMGTK